MTDAISTLIWKLKAATGYEVYPAPSAAGTPTPHLTVQMISDPMLDQNHSAGGAIHNSRVQIGHIGTYDQARPLVDTVQQALEGNRTDFLATHSDGVYLERNEGEDIYMLIKGYFLKWKA